MELGPNIARNTALSENVFMMVICIELRIPLFVVGKPGSSKSLAKTVVYDNMQGDAARSNLFKAFKQVPGRVMLFPLQFLGLLNFRSGVRGHCLCATFLTFIIPGQFLYGIADILKCILF